MRQRHADREDKDERGRVSLAITVSDGGRWWVIYVALPMTRTVLLSITLMTCVSCATTGQAPDRGTVDAAIRARTAAGIRVEGAAPLPPDASIEDGLTSQEAVSIALWNSPSFQATLADLGIARADLVEAGLLRNPVFSLLFPVGPKQLEWTLQFPIDALWQRPQRVAAAQLNAQAVGERLVWDALTLVAQTRIAHAEAMIADRRLQLTIENADLVQRLAGDY